MCVLLSVCLVALVCACLLVCACVASVCLCVHVIYFRVIVKKRTKEGCCVCVHNKVPVLNHVLIGNELKEEQEVEDFDDIDFDSDSERRVIIILFPSNFSGAKISREGISSILFYSISYCFQLCTVVFQGSVCVWGWGGGGGSKSEENKVYDRR